MGIRRKARELVLNALYQGELNNIPPKDKFPLLCDNFEINKRAVPYGQELVDGVTEKWDELNSTINENAKNWRLSRMSVLDRNIIRLATYEILFRDDVPHRVAINEAIELAKRFCTDDSPSFINGVLDAIVKNLNLQE